MFRDYEDFNKNVCIPREIFKRPSVTNVTKNNTDW